MPDVIAVPAPSAVPAAKVEAPAAEAAKPAPAAPAPEVAKPQDYDAKIAKAFGELNKKERSLLDSQRKLAAEKNEISKMTAQYKAWEDARAAAKRDPLAYLKAAGLSYDDLTQVMTNNGALTPELQTKAEIGAAQARADAVAKELADYKAQQEQAAKDGQTRAQRAQAEQDKQVYQQFYNDTVAFVKANVAEYELINLHEAQAEVPRLIEMHHEKTGKLLSKEDAAKQVEDYLMEKMEKAVASEKWKKKTAKPVPAAKAPDEEPAAPAQRRTLSNDLSAISKPATPRKGETQEERMARAKAAYEKAKGQ